MVKNLLLSYDFFPMIGGAHTWMYEAYKRFDDTVHVFAQDYASRDALGKKQAAFDSEDHGALEIRRVNAGIADISLLSMPFWRHLRYMTQEIKQFVQKGPCVLHSLRAFPEGIAAAVYKAWVNPDCRLVTYVHGEELNVAATSRQLSFLAHQVLARSDLIIVNSRATLEKTKGFCSACPPTAVIHPGVDHKVFDAEPERVEALRTQWGVKAGEQVLITMARLEPRKNHAAVLNAMEGLKQKGIHLRYIIGSEGEEEAALKGLAGQLGLSDQVVFTGYMRPEEKNLAFSAADIHIMPSIEHGPMVEGFGIVFIEAAAAGTPSIAGNSGGQAEAVQHNETGLVVDGTRVDEVAAAIEKLALDTPLRETMGRAARQWAAQHDWDNVARKTVEAVKNIRGK